jgi:hypothetical protein
VFLSQSQETLGLGVRVGGAVSDGNIAEEAGDPHGRYAKHGDGGGRISPGVPDAVLRVEHISGL